MTDIPAMAFRRLAPEELELAVNLVQADNADDSESESFGHERITTPPPETAWGLFIKGSLAGSAWIALKSASGEAEVTALILLRGWRKLGLAAFMLQELAKEAHQLGAARLVVSLNRGGAAIGAALTDAGFKGPDILSEGYPLGIWSKPCA